MGSTVNRWQALKDLGEVLLKSKNINEQIALFERELCTLMGAAVRVELSQTFFNPSEAPKSVNPPEKLDSPPLEKNVVETHSDDGLNVELMLPFRNETPRKIIFTFDKEYTLNEQDRGFLQFTANFFALISSTTSQNNQLTDTAQEQTWISNVMQQISAAALEYDNLEDLLGAITRIIPLLIDVNRCAIFLKGRLKEEFILEAQFGYAKLKEGTLAMLPFSPEGELAILSLENGEPFATLPKPNISGCEESHVTTTGSCLIYSLSAHANMYGFLLVDVNDDHPVLIKKSQSQKSEVLQSVCRQIALSIENLQLTEAKEIETYTTTVLLQSAEAIASTSSIREALENICTLLPLFIGIDTTIFYLINQKHETYHLNAYYSIGWKLQSKNLPGQFRFGTYPGLDLIVEEKNPVNFKIEDVPPEDWLKINDIHIFERVNDHKSPEPLLMVFPLHLQDELSGVMIVRESEEGYENREKKVEIIKGVARQISVALQNEQLKNEILDRERMKKEFQFAQEIQRTFLPDNIQDIPGCEIHAVWRPALQLGGDFYDVFPLDRNRFGFIVADVSDKGIPAALYMTVARTLIHASAKEDNKPSTILEHVNSMLIENSQEGLFVTVIYAVLDLQSGALVYTNAGHNQPIWFRKKQNEIHWLAKGGLPLGVSDNIQLEDHSIKMEQGDVLVMYSDGVTECKSEAGGFFGEDRLFNVMNTYKRVQSTRLIDLIDTKLLDFQQSEAPSDDVTILTIKRTDF